MRGPGEDRAWEENNVKSLNESADFYDVCDGLSMRSHLYRFTGTEEGFLRAKTYVRNYNESLRQAMEIPLADLELDKPDYLDRPDEYERAMRVQLYLEHCAVVRGADAIPVIADDEPLPTDYPHDF